MVMCVKIALTTLGIKGPVTGAFSMDGWIKLHRKLLDNEIFRHDKTAWNLFETLLLMANRTTGTYDTGRFQLADITGFKPTTVYQALKRLESTGMVTLTSNNKYTRITICKWSVYQGDGDNANDIKVTTNRQQNDTKQELRIKKKTYSDFEHLEPAITEFINMRKLIKSPLTEGALKRIISKVEQMYPNDVTKQQACLLQSVDHNWKGVFELKPGAVLARKETDGWT